MPVPSPASHPHPVRVMVVDDSAVVRGLISRLIEDQPDMEVAASAAHGEMALMELRRREVDVVVLDLEMPVMDGLTALPLILAEHPRVKVLIASTLTRRNGEMGMRALQLGASDYLPKPEAGGSLVTAEDFKRELLAKVRGLTHRTTLASIAAAKPSGPPPAPPPRPFTAAPIEVIAIGGSTGAPPVLHKLFEKLGAVRQPIVLVQHMPPIFTGLLAEQLARASGRPCAEGRDGEPVVAGRTYVAPGGWHMRVVRERGTPTLRLDQSEPEHFCRPAVDPLFHSVAETYGRGVLGVILTGMGSDGALGCEAVARAGGRFVAQDEATSAVWGMPGAAARTGLVEAVLPEAEIAPFLLNAVGAGR